MNTEWLVGVGVHDHPDHGALSWDNQRRHLSESSTDTGTEYNHWSRLQWSVLVNIGWVTLEIHPDLVVNSDDYRWPVNDWDVTTHAWRSTLWKSQHFCGVHSLIGFSSQETTLLTLPEYISFGKICDMRGRASDKKRNWWDTLWETWKLSQPPALISKPAISMVAGSTCRLRSISAISKLSTMSQKSKNSTGKQPWIISNNHYWRGYHYNGKPRLLRGTPY